MKKITKLFGHNEQQYVWRGEGEALHRKSTIPVNHGGGSVMLRACFAASGSAAIKGK